mgnify:FL=1
MFKRTLAAFFVIVLTCGTVACNDPSQRGDASDNPKEGVVRVFPDNNVPSFYKRCDGTTLIYWFEGDRRGGLTAVPDSPECK